VSQWWGQAWEWLKDGRTRGKARAHLWEMLKWVESLKEKEKERLLDQQWVLAKGKA